MFTFRRISLTCAVVAALVFAGSAPQAQTASAAGTQARPAATPQTATAGHITSPKEEWGHNVGDDYFLATYQQLITYWHKLEKESPKIHIKEIGKTAENRPHLMAVITAPENYAKIDRYRQISSMLSNVVRNASWRRTISLKLCSSASRLSWPSRRPAPLML